MGHMTLNRILTLTELYKQSIDVVSQLADVGIYKGGSSFLFAKLIKIFESESNVLCHGLIGLRTAQWGERPKVDIYRWLLG